MKVAPAAMLFFVPPAVLAADSESRKTYGVPKLHNKKNPMSGAARFDQLACQMMSAPTTTGMHEIGKR